MAHTLSIDISDHNTTGVCTSSYIVQYKITGDPSYTVLPNQYDSPIVIAGLLDSTDYEIYIQRQCCDGNFSDPLIFTYNTLPLTDLITGLALTPGSESIAADWDNFTGADGYKMYISQTNDIDTAVLVYTGATSAYTATGLDSGTTYYVWVQAYIGYQYSAFATDNATTP